MQIIKLNINEKVLERLKKFNLMKLNTSFRKFKNLHKKKIIKQFFFTKM